MQTNIKKKPNNSINNDDGDGGNDDDDNDHHHNNNTGKKVREREREIKMNKKNERIVKLLAAHMD